MSGEPAEHIQTGETHTPSFRLATESTSASGLNTPFGALQGTPLRAADYLFFVAIFLLALSLRIIYLVQISKSPLFDSPILDAEAHDQWARMILDGVQPFQGSAYFKAPLYPFFLAFTRLVFGDQYWFPRIVQIMIGSATCGFVYLIGRDAFNRLVGVIAGIGAALYWVMIYFDAELLLEPLSTFFSLVSLWLILRAAKHATIWPWIAAGLFMGLSAITRPNVLIYMPFVALWILWIERNRFRFAFSRAVAWSVACAIPILPVTLRNYVAGNDLVLIAASGGPNFYIGNNPQSDGYTAQIPGARASWVGGFQDWTTMAEQAEGRKLKASEVDAYFFDQAFAFMRALPGRAVNLLSAKVQLFFYEWEIPNDSDLYGMAELYAPFVLKLPVKTGLILALGLVGFVMALGHFKRMFPLTSFVVLYTASVIVFFVCARFRVPVMPLALVFAALVPVRMFSYLREKDWRAIIGYGVFIYLAWIGINRGVGEPLKDKYRAITHHRIGLKLGEKNLPGEDDEYRKALELDPRCAEAETGLAFFNMRRNRPDEAIKHFRTAITMNAQLDVYGELGSLLALAGRWDESIDTFRKGLAALPGYLKLKRNLAFILATCPIDRLRAPAEAVRLAEEVAAVGEQIPETYDALAVSYAADGRFDEAVEAAEKALSIANRAGMIEAANQISRRLSDFRRKIPYRQPMR
ncbi:MAG TPA: glycosyltransferase family 39 protein [Phycisphaerae bacterium]|nr:glycosyltransferase family 39 protein [Phycisphaerae bacterium]